MSQLDQALRRALSPEDLRLLDELSREEPLFIQAIKAFQDQHRLIGYIGWMGGFGLFGLACYFAYRFIDAPDLRTMILWGAATGLTVVAFSMIKLWFFMEMQKNNILREVKRLELQIASLRVIGAGAD
ncbi:MAG: hypothetical protein Q8L23_15410 [Caulobacter sp.]|nr:hypothetical protein [Caulobacter sp.]